MQTRERVADFLLLAEERECTEIDEIVRVAERKATALTAPAFFSKLPLFWIWAEMGTTTPGRERREKMTPVEREAREGELQQEEIAPVTEMREGKFELQID